MTAIALFFQYLAEATYSQRYQKLWKIGQLPGRQLGTLASEFDFVYFM
jgi:hypothetical protein